VRSVGDGPYGFMNRVLLRKFAMYTNVLVGSVFSAVGGYNLLFGDGRAGELLVMFGLSFYGGVGALFLFGKFGNRPGFKQIVSKLGLCFIVLVGSVFNAASVYNFFFGDRRATQQLVSLGLLFYCLGGLIFAAVKFSEAVIAARQEKGDGDSPDHSP